MKIKRGRRRIKTMKTWKHLKKINWITIYRLFGTICKQHWVLQGLNKAWLLKNPMNGNQWDVSFQRFFWDWANMRTGKHSPSLLYIDNFRLKWYKKYLYVCEFYINFQCYRREQFDQSLAYVKESLELRKLTENHQNSRELCETYFVIANIFLYKEEEHLAIENFLSAIRILELCLAEELSIPNQELPSIHQLRSDQLFREHLREGFLDTRESKELKNILNCMYDKLEDTLL